MRIVCSRMPSGRGEVGDGVAEPTGWMQRVGCRLIIRTQNGSRIFDEAIRRTRLTTRDNQRAR